MALALRQLNPIHKKRPYSFFFFKSCLCSASATLLNDCITPGRRSSDAETFGKREDRLSYSPLFTENDSRIWPTISTTRITHKFNSRQRLMSLTHGNGQRNSLDLSQSLQRAVINCFSTCRFKNKPFQFSEYLKQFWKIKRTYT